MNDAERTSLFIAFLAAFFAYFSLLNYRANALEAETWVASATPTAEAEITTDEETSVASAETDALDAAEVPVPTVADASVEETRIELKKLPVSEAEEESLATEEASVPVEAPAAELASATSEDVDTVEELASETVADETPTETIAEDVVEATETVAEEVETAVATTEPEATEAVAEVATEEPEMEPEAVEEVATIEESVKAEVAEPEVTEPEVTEVAEAKEEETPAASEVADTKASSPAAETTAETTPEPETATPAAPPTKPWLGLRMGRPTPSVILIFPGSGAADTKIQPGDTIVAIDGETIEDTDEVLKILATKTSADTIELVVTRGDEELTFPTFLGKERPAK